MSRDDKRKKIEPVPSFTSLCYAMTHCLSTNIEHLLYAWWHTQSRYFIYPPEPRPGNGRSVCVCVCVYWLLVPVSLLQASVFWSISYYSSPFAFFYLYRKGQCGFKGGGTGNAGCWQMSQPPKEERGPARVACFPSSVRHLILRGHGCPIGRAWGGGWSRTGKRSWGAVKKAPHVVSLPSQVTWVCPKWCHFLTMLGHCYYCWQVWPASEVGGKGAWFGSVHLIFIR